MATRWVCPQCGHTVNGPQRPRKDDVRRWCLTCSAKTGRLVERAAPRLEREREVAAARSATKAARKRAVERSKFTVTLADANGVERSLDVRAELRTALQAMGYFNGWAYGHKPTITELNVKIQRGQKPHHSGRAVTGGFDVWFTFGSGGSYEDGLHLIYHEAAHMADKPGAGHGREFHQIFADGLQKRWPWIVYGSLNPRQKGGCFEMGRRIVAQLEQRTRESGDVDA